MNWQNVKEKFRVIDSRGLSKDTVRTMRLLIVAVMGGMVWSNVTNGIAFTGYWKELGVSDTVYGVLLALPSMANAFQFIASYYMEKTLKRKKLFVITGLVQRVSWIPFALVPYLVPMGAAHLRAWVAGVLVLASASMMPFMNVSFFSICDDVIPIKIRGRYFAARSRVATVTALVVGILIGMLLDAMPGMPGYSAAFLVAGVMGTLDICCFIFMKLPPMRETPKKNPMFSMMRSVLSDNRYMRIVTLSTLFLFSVNFAAPYFNVYMQGNMKMTNLQITMFTQIASSIALILVVTRWGRALDRFGSKPIIMTGGFFVAIMPFFWLFIGKGAMLPVVLLNLMSGATWCAYDLGTQNLFMGQARGENKSMYFAVYFMFTQLLGAAFGSFSGGWVLDNLLYRLEPLNVTILGWTLTRYNYLFAISSAMRLIVLFVFVPRIIEDGAGSVGEFLGGARGSVELARTRFQSRLARRRMRNRFKGND